MSALPEKHKNPVHEEFHHYFNELENDFLNINQLLKGREKSGASFDTIVNELEALKEDASDCLNELHRLWNGNRNLFTKNTQAMLNQCSKLIQHVHPEHLTQNKWDFNEKWLNDWKRSLGF